jgi:uncharacterized protein (TIGR03083 family)
MFGDDALTALRQETRALSTVLHELNPAQFTQPTNCPPWNLQELIVHMAASIAIRNRFPTAEPQSVLASAADYYRRPERDTPAYRQRNVDQTQQLARTVLADAAPARWFDQVSRDTLARLGDDDLDRAVLVPGRGAMRLADWIVTRVISIAAHGLDVAITLDRDPWTTGPALTIIRPVFVDLLGSEPPASLQWDDQALLATATGRRLLTDCERMLLGSRQARFPLLS